MIITLVICKPSHRSAHSNYFGFGLIATVQVGFTHKTSMTSHIVVDTEAKPTYSLSERVTAVH